jgi:hypothetical protein
MSGVTRFVPTEEAPTTHPLELNTKNERTGRVTNNPVVFGLLVLKNIFRRGGIVKIKHSTAANFAAHKIEGMI